MNWDALVLVMIKLPSSYLNEIRAAYYGNCATLRVAYLGDLFSRCFHICRKRICLDDDSL